MSNYKHTVGDRSSSISGKDSEVPVATYNVINLPHRMPKNMKRKREMIKGVCRKKLKTSQTIQIFDTGEIIPENCSLLNKIVLDDILEKHIYKETHHTGNVQKLKENPELFICDFCNRAFKTRQRLRCHINIHEGVKPYKCDQCSKSYFNDATLSNHRRRVHHNEAKQCSCNDCGQKLSVRDETKKYPFSCNVCEERFSSKDNLRLHLVNHTEEYKFTCGHCGIDFINFSFYTNHLAVHEGGQSYVCQVCDVLYSHPGTLRKHSILHYKNSMNNEEEICCAVCSKVFSSKSTLKEHIKLHTKLAEKNDENLRIREAKKWKYFTVSDTDKCDIEKRGFSGLIRDEKKELKKSGCTKENCKTNCQSVCKQQKVESGSSNESKNIKSDFQQKADISKKSSCGNEKGVKKKHAVKSKEITSSRKRKMYNEKKSDDHVKNNSSIFGVKKDDHYHLPEIDALVGTENSVVFGSEDLDNTPEADKVQKTNASEKIDGNHSLEIKARVAGETETNKDNCNVISRKLRFMEIMRAMKALPTREKRVIRSRGGDLLTLDIGFEYF